MGMLDILANSQNSANENFLNSVQQATGAWGGLMDNLTYKAAGNELIALMQTKPVDQEIEPMDIIKVAQKYKLPQEKMMNLMQMLDTSGALRAAQQERSLAMKEAKAKERLVDETQLPSDVAGDIVKAGAKPQTGKTWGEVRIAGPDDPNAQEGSRYQISSDGAVKILNQGSEKQPTAQDAAKAISNIDKAIYRLQSLGAIDDPFMAMAASANPELAEKLEGVPPDEAIATLEAEREYWLQYAPESVKNRYEKKPLDEGTARQLLKEAGGDKDKARELARKKGYAL